MQKPLNYVILISNLDIYYFLDYVMRKFLILLSSILFVFAIFTPKVFAYASEEIASDIILPSSYLQYYELNAPQDVWTDGTEFIICETDKIIYFDGKFYSEYSLPEYSISRVYKVDNFILFLSSSKIYTINITTNQITEQSQIFAGTSFYIQGNVLITNPSSEIRYYNYSVTEGVFQAEEIVISRKSLTFTPSLIALDEQNTLFYIHEGNLYKVNDANSEIIATQIPNARSIIVTDNVYISFEDGLQKFTLNGEKLKFLATSGERKLDKISHPRGISIADNYLYIADDNLNAILQYDLTTDELTDFYITTNHNATKRISTEAKSIYATEKTVYVLDTNYVKAIDVETENVTEIQLTGFSGFKMLASTNNTFLLSSGTNLILATQENGALKSIEIQGNLSRLENVSALATFENDYYVLNNETVNNQQRAVIYKLSSQKQTLTQHSTFAGRGDALTTDVFGDIYVEIYSESDGKYYVYSTDVSATKHKQIAVSSEKMISIFADYEGNLFSLLSNNQFIKTTPNSAINSVISVSQNLPENSSCIDFSIYQGSKYAYFLYKGFVLKASADSIQVATPQKIKVPENFKIEFNQNPSFVSVKNGAKLFEVSLDNASNFGEYFNYKSMRANTDTEKTYIELTKTDRYSLILNDGVCAIVRSEDTVSSSVTTSENSKTTYAVNNCNLYAYPVIKDYTKTISVEKNQAIEIIKTFNFNEFEFALVKINDGFGYLAKSMLKDGIASNLTTISKNATVVTLDATLYFNQELSDEFCSIKKGSEVLIIEENENYATVLYDGKVCYVSKTSLTPKNTKVLKNVLVISLLFIALFSSGAYIVKRILNKKGMSR